MKKWNSLVFNIVTLLVALPVTMHGGDQTPLRSKFPGVKTISIEQLNKEFNEVVIVDTRTDFEST